MLIVVTKQLIRDVAIKTVYEDINEKLVEYLTENLYK